MTVQRLVVLLQGQPVGTVDRDRRADLRLTYLDEWRSRPDATPLSSSLPRRPAHMTTSQSTPSSGPPAGQHRRPLRMGRRFQVSHRDAFSLLSTPVGEDCAGAVQLVAEDRVDDVRDGGDMTWLTPDEV